MRFALVVSMLFTFAGSSAARAMHASFVGSYEGSGTWRTTVGTSGIWDLTLEISAADKGFRLQEKLTIHEVDRSLTVEESDWLVEARGGGFFDVVEDGKVIGFGRCEGSTCQIERQRKKQKERYVETLRFLPTELEKIGYEVSSNFKSIFAWNGTLPKREAPVRQ